jgi:predicted nucleic acid-binding protein
MIVVDASFSIAALVTDGAARTRLIDSSVVVPHLADAEIANALRRLSFVGEVSPGAARRALATWAQLGVERVGTTHLLDRVYELRPNLSAYDATYVALAESLDIPLATCDHRLARAPGTSCTFEVSSA